MTKTSKLRQSKDKKIRIIESDGGGLFLLIQREYMVRLVQITGSPLGYSTLHLQSLPWTVVKYIVNEGRTGRIRNGWRYKHVSGQHLRIGCQTFSGDNYRALTNWAAGQ